MSTVTLKSVRKSFGTLTVIPEANLAIKKGEFCVFVGPSGCGKSTLLRMIAGLETVSSGEIQIGDRRVDGLEPGERGVSMVFQSYALYPHMTVRANLAFCLQTAGWKRPTIEARVQEVAAILKIEPLLAKKPGQLSGGQRQRVAIGRAIMRKPEVFLFDEPQSNLDAGLRVHMRLELARLHRDMAATMIYVTHDQVEAMTLADRIVVFNQGRIEQVGTPDDLYQRPDNVFVAQFLGAPRINLLTVVAVKDGAVTLQGLAKPLGSIARPAVEAGQIGCRPEHAMMVAPGEGDIQGTVALIENLGGNSIVYVDYGAVEPFAISVQGRASWQAGMPCGIALQQQHLHSFDAQGHALT
jgi:ABC-type sugar transport system ATPase subunit